mmetsp:Transcript_21926/g.67333  ORF Transcript_21926/g.67333 Transcript_21926/m.67333 type:complete len:182 (+) Transcript_21926:308-853(+)
MGLVRVAVAALAGAALVRDTEGFAGFGSRPKPAKGKPKKGKGGLAPDAAKILDKANGNLDAAQGMLFQQQAMKLKDKDPALFRAMETHAAGTPMPDAMHEKLVELTWDTVAAYLPVTASRAPADDVKVALALSLTPTPTNPNPNLNPDPYLHRRSSVPSLWPAVRAPCLMWAAATAPSSPF